jgi:LacI family transcriptional regulator
LTGCGLYAILLSFTLSISPHFANIMTKKATLKEVAQAAGVSTQTVSRVVNQHPDVAEDTRHHVQRVIDSLNYRPNFIARSLITRRSSILGVVATGLEYYGPTAMLVGIQQEAERLGYSLTLLLTHEPEKENFSAMLYELAARQVAGIIWSVPPVGQNRSRTMASLVFNLPPIIFLNQPDPAFHVATIDNRQGATTIVNHMIEQGYENIGIIYGPLSWWEATERRAGWEQALINAGRTATISLQSAGDWTAQGGEIAFRSLLQNNPNLDAVFACNDQMALGVLKAAHCLGISVPDQLGVCGFDDYPESAFFIPALTTIHQPLRELGAAAVRETVLMIQAQHDGVAIEPHTLTLQPHLIIRESTARKISGEI